MALGFTVGGVVAQFEAISLAAAAGESAGIILFLAAMLWSYHAARWFPFFMAVVLVIHVIAIVLIPWPPNHSLPRSWIKGVAVVAVVDFFAMGGLAMLMERLLKKFDRRPSST
jgi:hypothetical protein